MAYCRGVGEDRERRGRLPVQPDPELGQGRRHAVPHRGRGGEGLHTGKVCSDYAPTQTGEVQQSNLTLGLGRDEHKQTSPVSYSQPTAVQRRSAKKFTESQPNKAQSRAKIAGGKSR